MNRHLLLLISIAAISSQAHAFKSGDRIRVCSELAETTYWRALVHLGSYEKIRYNEAERRVTKRLLEPETSRTLEHANFLGESAHGNRGGKNLSANDARANGLRAALDFFELCLVDSPESNGQPAEKTIKTANETYIEEIKIDRREVGQAVVGADVYFTIKNPNKDSAIKYLKMTFTTLNSVGDPIKDFMGNSQVNSKYTGPLKYGDEKVTVKYGHLSTSQIQPECIRIDRIEIEYMNGQLRKFNKKNMADAINPSQPNGCPLIK